jgi:hypothetical protein
MKLKTNLKYISIPAKIFMTVLVLLFAVLILQGIIIATDEVIRRPERRTTTSKSQEELSQEEKRLDRINRSAKEFFPDGTIHLVYVEGINPGRKGEAEREQIYDVNDNLLWEGLTSDSPYKYLSWADRLRRSRDIFTNDQMKQMQMITPAFSRTLEVPVRSEQNIIQIWRYNPAKDYFVGYANGEKIGYIGSTGFTKSKSQSQRFGKFKLFTAWCPMDSLSPTLLWQTQSRIYEINFEKQEVDLLLESPEINMVEIPAWRDLKPGTEEYIDTKEYRPMLRCITKDGKHHLIMQEPQQKLTITVPEDWKNWYGNHCRFTATKEAIFMYRGWIESSPPPDYRKSPKLYQQWRYNFHSQPQNSSVELYRVDNQGKLKLLNHYSWTIPARPESVVKIKDSRTLAKRYVSKFSPPLYDWAWHLLGIKVWSEIYQHTLTYEFAQMMAEIRPGDSIFNLLLSAAMMCFALWHAWGRRTSKMKLAFWLALVGAFNLAGLLTYLALNHTAVIRCPVCGRNRGLTQVNCVRCGEDLPAPERGKLDLIFNKA